MKVASLESNEDTTATEKPSFASRLLLVLIKLNVVPVKLDQDGKGTFRLLSFRFFLSFACWYLPFIGYYATQLFYFYTSGRNEIALLAEVASKFSWVLFAMSQPYCLGYLVGQSELLIPTEIASTNLLKLVLIWAIAVTNYFLPEILGEEQRKITRVDVKIVNSLLILELQICLGILKIICNSFKRKCDQLKTAGNFYATSTRTLDLYKSIKAGAGPIFFVIYSYCTLFIIINLYQAIVNIIPFSVNVMGMLATLLMVYELSAYGQGLYADICSSAMLVR